MALDSTLCVRCVGADEMIKYGKTKSGKQRYICKKCGRTKVVYYSYNACQSSINQQIIVFTKEGLGIRSTSRVLKISITALLRRIVWITKSIKRPMISFGKTYEVDEMRTYIACKNRLIWIVYALERETKQVVSLHVGSRTNAALNVVLKTLKLANTKAIYTDKHKNYRYLIASSIHKTRRFGTNHIERKNLSVRTHLKRLNRRTICFSRSELLLVSVLKIYFWL